MRCLSIAICAGLLVGTAEAQTLFRADLDGGQEVPSVSTNALGYARVILNSDDTVTYDVRTILVTGTAANIEIGGVGVAGPMLFALSGGPSAWSGTTTALSATDKTNLRASGLYVNVLSTAFPGGEIRGQIVPKPLVYGAHLTEDQEVPPTGSTAVGDATFVVNSDLTITYNMTVTGLSANGAHIHTGGFGTAGPILFFLTPGPTTWSGTTKAMKVSDFNNLQANGLYVNVHTIANPGGEIRGQIVPTEVPYNFGYPSSAGVPKLSATGAAMRGGTVAMTVAGGLPNGTGLLIFSLSDGIAALRRCPYLLGSPLLILPLPLDAAGGIVLSSAIPDLSSSLDVYFQFIGFEIGGPNGNLYSTNGLLIPIFDY